MSTLSECSLMPELLALPRPAEWSSLRSEAEKALEGTAWPTLRQEDWKYTDLSEMKARTFKPGALCDADLDGVILPEAVGSRLVFVNGHYSHALSNVSSLHSGVRMLRLGSASEAAKGLGQVLTPEKCDVFAKLNTARFHDGALIFVPKDVRVEGVLHVLFLSTQKGEEATCSLPRLLIQMERGSQATVVEEYAGVGAYATNALVEVHLGENADLTHERVQRESREAFHFSNLGARLERSARYACRTISLGAKLSRQNPKVWMHAGGTDLELSGLALLDQNQVADTHSLIDHSVAHCQSHQVHKLVLDGASRGVFNGKIFVHPGAQQTDARQQCRGLLLSENAQIDAKPELEIYADDVKCAHGAAIGQLDPEELFYLQSRGLNPQESRNLLTYAFAADVLAPIKVESLKKQLRQAVMARTGTAGI